MPRLGLAELIIVLVVIAALAYGVKRSRGAVRVLAIIGLVWACLALLVMLPSLR